MTIGAYILSMDNSTVVGTGQSGNWQNIDSSDARVVAYLAAQTAAAGAATIEAAAAAALATGVVLTSTATPALNGSYPIGPDTETYMIGIISYISLKSSFPGNSSTLNWYDASDTAHSFTVSAFQAFAEAMCAFIHAVADWELGGGVGSLPSNSITIP